MKCDTYNGTTPGDCPDCRGTGDNHGYEGNGGCPHCYGSGRITAPTFQEALERRTSRLLAMMGAPTPAPVGGPDEDEALVAAYDELAYLVAVMWRRSNTSTQQRWYEEMDDRTLQSMVLQRVLIKFGLLDSDEVAR